MDNYKVTSIDELIVMSRGEVVELPPFTAGQHFYARLKRPSLMNLMKQGKIPNGLLTAANSLFNNTTVKESEVSDTLYKDVLSVIDILAEASFVEPSWDEIKNAGIELTDEQYMSIFNYTQTGIKALEPFHQNTQNTNNSENVSTVPVQTEQVDANIRRI